MPPQVELRPSDIAAVSAGMGERAGPPWEVRWLTRSLKTIGVLDLLAAGAVLLPYEAMNAIHRMCGLGELPREPIVGYLARSASVLYALHGAMVLFIASDVARYWGLVRFLAILAVVHGIVLAGIDAWEGLPLWWRIVEGACIAAIGAMILALQRRIERAAPAHRPNAENGRSHG